VHFADRSEEPWQVVEGIEFRAVTLVAHLPAGINPRIPAAAG
jgi:arsenite methyltransferase